MSFSGALTRDEITDNIIKGFDIADYLTRTDSEIIDLAQSMGVDEDDIENAPLPYKVKEYAKAFLLAELCQDKSGTNNPETPEFEKYVVKHEMYRKKADKLRRQINYEVLTGSVAELRDRAVVDGTIFHG